jgi:hypothetical protein
MCAMQPPWVGVSSTVFKGPLEAAVVRQDTGAMSWYV